MKTPSDVSWGTLFIAILLNFELMIVVMKIFSFIRDREMKVAARNEALQQAAEELQKKIEQKVGV